MGDWLVRSISVEGFQGYRTIAADFDREPWFLIGRNGAGKTTLIELLNACLRLDYPTLSQIAFSRIQVSFFCLDNERRPTLTLFRQEEPGSPSVDGVVGEIFEATGEPPRPFLLDSHYMFEPVPFSSRRRPSKPDNELTAPAARAMMRRHIDLSWLSVHRGTFEPPEFDDDDEPVQISPIDSKLRLLTNAITRYFSALDSRAAQATQRYQQNFFLSLLSRSGAGPQPLSQEDVIAEKNALRSIFLEFGMAESVFSDKLNVHFDAVERTNRALRSPSPENEKNLDILALLDTIRIHDLVEQWRQLQAERAEIYISKNRLRDILNSLLYNKTMEYTERNSLQFIVSSFQTQIDVHRLSSGEKQMFILLAEAMLQENRACVYLADEPELSLHVDWQERLVDHIRALNPNAQIIFATHSPDIVSSYTDNVIKMESL